MILLIIDYWLIDYVVQRKIMFVVDVFLSFKRRVYMKTSRVLGMLSVATAAVTFGGITASAQAVSKVSMNTNDVQLASTAISDAAAKQAGINGFNQGIAGYPARQCTGFVGSILKAKGVPQSQWSYLGNGNQWADKARSRGIKVDRTPTPGSVVSFKAYGSSYYGAYGHVAYITRVNANGTVHIYEGNFSGRAFNERDIKIDSAVAGVIHFGGEGSSKPSNPTKPGKTTSAIDAFKKGGNKYVAQKAFRVDALKNVNGHWLAVNYSLAGGKEVNWALNGIPVEILDKTDASGKKTANQVLTVGNYAKFTTGYDHGTIDAYDVPSNGVGIKMGSYGMKWFNADALLKL